MIIAFRLDKQTTETFLMKTYNHNGTECILLNYGRQMINVNQISYLEGERNYTRIKCMGEKAIFTSFTLKRFSEPLLSDENFFCPRKGLVINLNELKSIFQKNGNNYIRMTDGTEHPISRRKGKELIDFITFSPKWHIDMFFFS